MRAKQGTFQLSTAAAGNVQRIGGIGFRGKVGIFWWEETTALGDAAANGDLNLGFGVAISAAERRCMDAFINDAATSGPGRVMRNDCCIAMYSDATTIDGLADFSSWTDDGFILTIDNAFASAWTVHYLILGGDDLTGASLVDFLEPAATGNQSTSGAGFEPEAILLFGNGYTGALNTIQSGAMNLCFGAAVSPTERGLVAMQVNYAAGASVARRYAYDAECWAREGATPLARADFVSFDVDGFTLNWLERTETTRNIFALCLRGGAYHVDTFLTATDSLPFARTGYGFRPAGALYFSHLTAKNAQDTQVATGAVSIGAASSPVARSSVGMFQTDGGSPTNDSHWSAVSDPYSNYNVTPSVQGLMGLFSFDGDGQTLIMDDPDPGANFILCLAFGPRQGGVPFRAVYSGPA